MRQSKDELKRDLEILKNRRKEFEEIEKIRLEIEQEKRKINELNPTMAQRLKRRWFGI